MRQYLRENGVPDEKCNVIMYNESTSLSDDSGFIRVFNSPTPEWSELSKLFGDIDFLANIDSWMDKKDGRLNVVPGKRGNSACEGGFCSRHMPLRTKSDQVAFPGKAAHTARNIPNMVALSRIAVKVR